MNFTFDQFDDSIFDFSCHVYSLKIMVYLVMYIL